MIVSNAAICYSFRVNRPPVPQRRDSLGPGSVPESTMESLVGRAKYEGPACARVKNAQPNTSLPDGYCDRLFQQECDTYSMQSYASSIAPSVAPVECDYNHSVPSATVTTADGVNISLSQESNGSVVSTSSSESSKDQPALGEIMQRKTTSSFQRKQIMKKKNRPNYKSPSSDNLTDGKGFRKSLSPRDVIKEDEVLDLSQENDIIPVDIPQPLSPVQVSSHL